MIRCLLATILSCFFITLFAQPKQLVFDHYSFPEGFSSREGRAITSTKDGMIWITTIDGLTRFNSKQFKFYRHIEGDSNSLTHNYCSSIQVDNRGKIWLVSGKDLEVFDPRTEVFKHVKFYNEKNEVEPVNPHSFFYDSTADLLWITTRKGLFFSKNGSFQLQSIEQLTQNKIFAQTHFNVIANDGTKYLWLNFWHKMYKLNLQSGIVEDSVIVPEMIDGINNKPNFFNLRCAYLDKNKVLWMGTWLNGLIEYNTITKQFHQYTYSDHTKIENTIFALAETDLPGEEDILWVGTHSSALCAFNKRSKKFTSYQTKIINNIYGITGAIYSLYSKANDGLWIGSSNGLHRYDYSKQLFNKIDLTSISNGVDMYPIDGMAMEQNELKEDRRLWMIVPYKNAYIYDFAAQKILPLPTKVAKYFAVDIGIWQFFIDSQNTLWISTTQFGLVGYSINDDRIIFQEGRYFNQTREWATSFFEDSKQQLWVGSFKGLFKMNETRTDLSSVNAINDVLKQNQLSLAVTDMTEDKAGKIWMTTDHTEKKIASICQFNPANNQAKLIYNEKEVAYSINTPSVDFRDILIPSKSDKVYVNNFNAGIFWFHTDSAISSKHYLTSLHGVTSSYLIDLEEDFVGNIWCGIDVGVACYKPADNSFVNYSYFRYGMGDNDMPNLFFSKQSGIVYLGETNAVVYFDHRNALKNVAEANLVFNAFKVFNKPYIIQENTLLDGGTIELAPDQNMISIEFALLSYTNAQENTYSWMLKGLDNDWTTSKNNLATYTNLDAGNYSLLVKAANSHGQWTKKVAQLNIVIKQRFYKTWWFLLLCLATIGLIIYYIFQLRLRRLQEKFKLRNKIATDLHDEIGSTLTSISILSSVSQQAMDKEPEQAKEMLQQINSQSKQIQQNMSDIVWSIRPDNEKIENLVARMREYAGQTLEPQSIATNIAVDGELLSKVLSMDDRKELLLIYKEAVNNIVKHAQATEVKIELTKFDHHLQLTIEDNGQWKGNGQNTGTGTKSMQQRAAAINGKLTILPSEVGTTVKLIIAIT